MVHLFFLLASLTFSIAYGDKDEITVPKSCNYAPDPGDGGIRV